MTSGTSCGMASQFGTPLSGILFTLEITPSYYFIRNYWLAALSSVIGGMIVRMYLNVSSKDVSVFAPIFSDIVIPHPTWFASFMHIILVLMLSMTFGTNFMKQATRSNNACSGFVFVSGVRLLSSHFHTHEFFLL